MCDHFHLTLKCFSFPDGRLWSACLLLQLPKPGLLFLSWCHEEVFYEVKRLHGGGVYVDGGPRFPLPTKYHSQPPLSRAILPFYGNVESFFIWNTWKKCWCAYSAKKCTHGKTYEGYHKSRMSFQHLTREDLNLEQTSICTVL